MRERGDLTTLTPEGIAKPLVSVLEGLRGSADRFMAVALGDANGLPIAFVGPTAEKEAATAMASLLMAAAQRATQILGLPRARDLVVYAGDAAILVRPAGERFTLLAILGPGQDVERARLLLQSCADDARILLEESSVRRP